MPSAARVKRHNLIRDAVARFMRACVPTARISLEQPVQAALRPGRHACIADIIAETDNRSYYLDIAVTSNTSPSAMSGARSSVSVPRAAAANKEQAKFTDYANAFTADVAPRVVERLTPFVLETS